MKHECPYCDGYHSRFEACAPPPVWVRAMGFLVICLFLFGWVFALSHIPDQAVLPLQQLLGVH